MINKKYFFVKLRTNKKYLLFLFFQLILSLFIALTAIFSDKHFKNPYTILAEYVLCLCIAADLLIRVNSQSQFLKNKQNILDLIIFVCLIVIIIFVSIIPQKQDSVILETDDIILLTIIIVRYLIQMVRLIFMIKRSHETILIQKDQNNIDLVNIQTNKEHTKNEIDMQKSEILKNKIINANKEQIVIQS